MLAKQVNGRLLCSLSEFEARLLKDVLGQISFVGAQNGDPTKAAITNMCDVLGMQGVYFTGGTFSGKLSISAATSSNIASAMTEDGWATQHDEEH